jgi:uncharacterized protein
MPTLAVAAVSARMLAEAAARDGYAVAALDCFGDLDTRRASRAWHDIGGHGVRIDAARTLAALRDIATQGDTIGWIAGSGFEGEPQLVEQGAAVLPLLGTAPAALRRLRTSRSFFERLDALGIAHPETRFDAPGRADGWLCKDGGGHGGWHVRRLADGERDAPHGDRRYFQREAPGTPMSATFIADRREARLLGFNRLLVRPFGARPFVYGGAIGPLPLPPEPARALRDAVQALAREFAVAGLASLDFLLDGDAVSVLELNARPSASMALYGEGWVRAHVQACIAAELPAVMQTRGGVAGHEIVYARRPLRLSTAAAAGLESAACCHDLPAAGTRFAIGDPVCSHSGRAADVAALERLLGAQREALWAILETS